MERLLMALKVAGNFVSVNNKVFYENQLHIPPPASFLDNLLNPNMNNINEFDYTNTDISQESDYVLSRWS